MSRYHAWGNDRELGCCAKRCGQCAQCKCEVGNRKFLCPGFNVHENPIGFEHWKLDLEIEELDNSIAYGNHDRRTFNYLVNKVEKLLKQKERLANGG